MKDDKIQETLDHSRAALSVRHEKPELLRQARVGTKTPAEGLSASHL